MNKSCSRRAPSSTSSCSTRGRVCAVRGLQRHDGAAHRGLSSLFAKDAHRRLHFYLEVFYDVLTSVSCTGRHPSPRCRPQAAISDFRESSGRKESARHG